MNTPAQRSRPEQIERIVTRLAGDVHAAVGGRAFPAKLIQTAVTVLSNDKAVSSEKWERVSPIMLRLSIPLPQKLKSHIRTAVQDVQAAKISLAQAVRGSQLEQRVQELDNKG